MSHKPRLLTLAVGFATATTIESKVWRLTVFGFGGTIGMILLARFLKGTERGLRGTLSLALRPSSMGQLSIVEEVLP